MTDLEDRVAALEEDVEDLREDIAAVRQTANKALGRSIDVSTDLEEVRDSDDRLSSDLSELQSTVRNLQTAISEQSSDNEAWAARLVENMLEEMAQYGQRRLSFSAREGHRSLQSEPHRTSMYDIFEKAAELAETDAVNHAKNPHRLQIDASKDELPRTMGLHTIDVPEKFCGASTTDESGVGGGTAVESDQPLTTSTQ